MKKKLEDRFVAYFLSVGYKAEESKNKYKLFSMSFVSKDKVHIRYVFLGRNGAVRVNIDSKAVLSSFSKTDDYKRILEKWEAGREAH